MYTIIPAGSDIGGTANGFYFDNKKRNGDFIVSTQVKFVQGGENDTWAKAGVIIRLSAVSNAAFMISVFSKNYGCSRMFRQTTDGTQIPVESVG